MAETIGLIASVIQVAGAGLKLSQTLYQYADGVATADRRIKDIAKEIQLTSFVIEELGNVFKQDETSTLMSKNAVKTASETMRECSSVFAEIDATLKKTKNNKLGRLMLPFRDTKIQLLRDHIATLKSTLQLLMQVLIHAQQVAAKKLDREAEEKQKAQIQELIELKKSSAKKYQESLKNCSLDGDTISGAESDDSEEEDDDFAVANGITMASMAIGSTINPKTLETCVEHIRSLLEDIETLQQALTEQVDGDDHSEHHQSLVGSYFRARGHLNSVLLGGAGNTGAATKSNTSLAIHARSTEVISGIQKTMTGSTLQSTVPLHESIAELDFTHVVQEAVKKARVEEQNKMQRGANAFRIERENILRDAEEKRIRLEELLKESTEKSTALSSSVMQQQPINFHDTYGRKYTFPFSTCRTWVGMHDRIKRIYRDRQMWSDLVASESFDLEDETGFIILPQDWSVFVQPGMSLALRFWPRPESSPEAVGSTIKRELVPVHKDLEKEQGEASSAEKEERPSWKRRKRFQRPLDTRNKWRSFEIFPSLATPKCPELTEVTITGFEGTQYKVHVNQLTGTYGQVKEALAFRHDWIKEILILSYADTIMADNELICASDLAGKILEVAGMASQYLPSEVTSSDTDLVLLDDDLNLDLDLGDMPSAIEIGRMDPKSAFHYAAKTEGFESNVQKPTPQSLQPKQFQDSNVEEPLKLGRRPKASRRITQQGLVEKVSLSEAEDEPEKVDKLTVRYGTGKAAEERAAGDGQTVPQLFSKVNMVEVNSGGKRVGRRSGPLIPQQRQQAHEIRAVPHRMRSEAHAPAPNVIIYNTTRMDNESSPNVRTEQRDPGPVRRRPSRRIPGESALEDQIAELQLELKREQRSRERSKQDEEGFDVIACICGSSEDDGNTVLCEVCETWQHIVCFYGPRPDIADVHECAECRPRHLDQNATIKAQGRRRSGKDQTDAHYQDGGRLAERKVKQAVKQRPKRSIMSPMASNTSLRMGDLEPQTPSSDPNTAELSAKGRQVQMPEDMQTAFKVGDEAQERNADTPARYSARMGPKESVLPNARRTPSLRTHTHSARHSLAMVRNQDPDSYSESSFEEDEWYTGYDRHIRTRPSHALKPPSNPKPLARLHSSTPPIQSVTPKMIMTQRRLREEEAEIRRKAAEDRAKVGDDQPNRSAFVHDPAAANLQRPESFPSRRLSVRQHAARMGTFRELLQHKRELLGRRYELDAILTGSIPQIERHQAESGMKRIVDELLNLELNLQREAQVLEGGFDPFAAPESQVRYTVSIGQAREIGSSDIKAEESRREGKARFEGSAAVQHRPYNPWQKPAGDHTRPQYDLQHTISMVNLHDETWHPKRPCSPATTSIAAYASGSAASSSLNYRQASARRPPPSLVANLPSARSPPSLSRSLSSSSPNLKAYDGFSSRKDLARHETKHNTGPTEAPPAVHPMTSATYVPGGESFGPGVGFPQLHVAAPRSSSPQSPEDVDSASIPLPQSPTLSGSVKFGSQAGPWSMHYSRNDTSPAALPIEQANHESAGSTGRFNVGLPVPTRRGHMAITVEDYSEDEDTFLYREMMEGLAGGESSEESEIEDDKVVLVEADRYEREDGKVDEVDELLREWTTVF